MATRVTTTEYHIRGMVQKADGEPILQATVKAFRKKIRGRDLLGEARNNAQGKYEIDFNLPGENPRPDVFLKAFDSDGKEIAASPVLFNIRPRITVDLIQENAEFQGPSLFQQVAAALAGPMETLTPAELTPEDAEFLAGKTGIEAEDIALFVQSHLLKDRTGLPARAFFAFGKMQLPTSLPALLTQEPDALRQAMEDAIEANIIPEKFSVQVDEVMAGLPELSIQTALNDPRGEGRHTLGALFTAAGIGAKRQREFLQRYQAHEGEIEAFWEALRNDADFNRNNVVDRLQIALQFGMLTQNHLPLVKELLALQENGDISAVEDLARFDMQDWLGLIDKVVDGQPVGVPPDIPGDSADERAEHYAATLMRITGEAYPTHRIGALIARDNLPEENDLQRFFAANPEFELGEEPLNEYLENHPTALDGLSDPEATLEQLKAWQRLFHLAPEHDKYPVIRALLSKGFTSAHRILRIGRSAFVKRFAELLGGEETAQQVYDNASRGAALALLLLTEHGADFHRATPKAMQRRPETVEGLPEWETLFGSLDFCGCEHCRSVLSPAAYLVDLLQFLEEQPGKRPGKRALDELLKRRPDIAETELTCENTNTVMPYVDLVNEILENAVAGGSEVYQTRGSAPELRVNPEHVNPQAYDILAKTVSHRSLPFNLYAREARTWLEHLGVPRYRLMEIFQPDVAPTSDDIAAEYLDLTPLERDIITGAPLAPHFAPDPAPTARRFWGISEDDWVEQLKNVELFLERSGLKYLELLELLDAGFVNPKGKLQVEFSSPGCNLKDARIPGLKEAALARINRFLRLQRKLDWRIRDLDKAIAIFSPGEINLALLRSISHLKRLRRELKRPLEELLSWYGHIDTSKEIDYETPDKTEPSFYERLFLNEAVLKPVDKSFRLNEARDELAAAGEFIRNHRETLQAAFHINAGDLTLLIDALFADNAGGNPTDALTLANLSQLYRHVSLARTLRIPVANLISLRLLSGIDPFVREQPENTLRFTEKYRAVKSAKIKIEELDYLLRHDFTSGSRFVPGETEIAITLGDIRSGLQAIVAENQMAPDPQGERTAEKLQTLSLILNGETRPFTEAEIVQALAIIGGTSEEPEASQKRFIDTFFADFVDTEDAKKHLLDTTPALSQEKRFAYILEHLLAYLRKTASEDFLIQKFAGVLRLDNDICRAILSEFVFTAGSSDQPAITVYLAPEFIGNSLELSTAAFPAAFDTYILLDKTAAIINQFKSSAEESRWMLTHGLTLGWLNPNDLPVQAPQFPSSEALRREWERRFRAWERLADAFRLRDDFPSPDRSIFTLLEMARNPDAADPPLTEEAFRNAIYELTGWKQEEVAFLAGAETFGLAFPDDFRGEQAYLRLQEAFWASRRLGIEPQLLKSWSTPEINAEQARQLKQAVKSQYEEKRWLEIAAPLADHLREERREALTYYLLAEREKFRDKNDLYSQFLIDVEMSACMMTSRIKQVNSSVQLFVQRCLMSLEEDIQFDPDTAEDWEWMKNYRVWEANRKVFLYPENWIEPELRDDKSPFFRDLENRLLQDEVTEETVEEAFLEYLQKLDEVARLEIAGMYEEKDEGKEILHIFGRTRGIPHLYYYRRWEDQARWTPWEKVELDIEGDHLIPVAYNRRLYLFWPIFTEKADEGQKLPGPNENGEKPEKYLEIGFAWSEYRNGHWSAKKLATQSIESKPDMYFKALRFKVKQALEDDKEAADVRKFLNSKFLQRQTLQKDNYIFKAAVSKSNSLVLRCFFNLEATRKIAPLFPVNGEGEGFKVHFELFRRIGVLHFNGCNDDLVVVDNTPQRVGTYLQPAFSRVDGMKFRENKFSEHGLRLVAGAVYNNGAFQAGTDRRIGVFRQTPGNFLIAYPHQYNRFVSQAPFIYEDEDEQRTLLVLPEAVDKIDRNQRDNIPLRRREQARPDAIDSLKFAYYNVGEDPFESDNGTVKAPGVVVNTWNNQRLAYVPVYPATSVESPAMRYRFISFYHPYTCRFTQALHRRGVEGLLNPHFKRKGSLRRQQLSDKFFEEAYQPKRRVVKRPYPKEEIDFSYAGAYSLYNWELFFHIPMLIATRLSQNQRFEEAQRWFHYTFNPTATDDPAGCVGDCTPARYWMFKPFYENTQGIPIRRLRRMLKRAEQHDEELELPENILDQVAQWRENPFNPHLLARMRISAYQKNTVMKYLDNLIAWGDQLFRRDSIESLNEATQLYVLTAEILGARPERLPEKNMPVITFRALQEGDALDAFSNACVELESRLAVRDRNGRLSDRDAADLPSYCASLLFCVPRNEKLVKYWDTLEDRLFKIRDCMNIEGVVRQLPLFEPPIDPALLVRARAMGVDLRSALSDLYAPLPHYRFQVMAQKATELCGEVRNLGASLLSTLEKRDAEELSRLRAGQEVQLLEAMKQSRKQAVKEAKETIVSLNKSKEAAEKRKQYYESREHINTNEKLNLEKLKGAHVWQNRGQALELAAGSLSLIPDLDVGSSGWAGSPVVKARFGGINWASAIQSASRAMSYRASKDNQASTMASIKGGYDRRADDWKFQAEQATVDIKQIEKQIAAAEIRLAIAENDLRSHELQIENAREADAFMRDKFTNKELYDWMVGQLSATYFQSYQLAYDLAKRTEKAFQHELGTTDSSFIQFGYWDSLKKGLLAGEKLHHDLKRMEVAYLDQNKREYELSKQISLAMLDPIALINLKEEGQCFVNLPEEVFDFDYPGHYMRRLKSVRLTIPCVTGPHTTVNCTLTLMGHTTRIDPTVGESRPFKENKEESDTRFRTSVGATQSVVTSSGQNDGGTFELNFRDERYLPFEGAGAVSSWRLELSTDRDLRQFDYDTITDAIMHISYTAREGGARLKEAAIQSLKDTLQKNVEELAEEDIHLLRFFSFRHEFPNKWHRFLHPANETDPHRIEIGMSKERFPFLFQKREIEIVEAFFFLKLKDRSGFTGLKFSLSINGSSLLPNGDSPSFEAGNPMPEERFSSGLELGDWIIEVSNDIFASLDETQLEDIFVVVNYRVVFPTN